MKNNFLYKLNDSKIKYVNIFQVKNDNKLTLKELIILLIFFIALPILWVVIRDIVFPTYKDEIFNLVNNNINKLDYQNQILYTTSILGFQILSPIIGAIILSAMMKKDILNNNLAFFFCIIPGKAILSLIISSFTSSVLGLNIFLIDFIYTGLIIIFIFLKNKNLKKMFLISWNNFYKTLIFIVLFTGIYISLEFLLSYIGSFINDSSQSGNQSVIKQMIIGRNFFPIFSIFLSVVIIAPIIEEIIYRMFLADFVRNRFYSYILTTFFFAFLHIQTIGDWGNILPYFALGIVNGFIYWKFKNITIPIFVHLLGNVLGFVMLFIIM